MGEERIAFASHRDDRERAGLYAMRPDGTAVQRLWVDPGDVTQPAWSPDGTNIAYAAWGRRGSRVHVARSDGSGAKPLTEEAVSASDPSWSPDGRSIVLSRYVDSNLDLYLVDVATQRSTRLTQTAGFNESGADWSPDGTRIVFQRWGQNSEGLYTMGRDGSGLSALTTAGDVDPAWSPDGHRIAFARFAESQVEGVLSLYVINLDGSGLRRVTDEPFVWDYGPDWSPDGSQLVFTRDPDGADQAEFAWATSGWAANHPHGPETGPLSSIYTIGTDGAGERRLTEPSSGDFYATWHGRRADG